MKLSEPLHVFTTSHSHCKCVMLLREALCARTFERCYKTDLLTKGIIV